MKTILDQDDEVPPFSPVKVALFVLLLGAITFAGWRFLRAQSAVAAVADASKDYRKLFPARSAEAPVPSPAPKPVATAGAPATGMSLLKIDDNMRVPKPAPPEAEPPPPEAPPLAEAPPVAEAKAPPAAPVKPAQKLFNQPRLNAGGSSRLNGGSGIGFSGAAGGVGGGGGKAVPAAAAIPSIPGLPAVPAPDKK